MKFSIITEVFASFTSSISSLNLQFCDDSSPYLLFLVTVLVHMYNSTHVELTHSHSTFTYTHTKYKFMQKHPICSSLRNDYSLHHSTTLQNLCPILLSQYYYTANTFFFFLVFVIQNHFSWNMSQISCVSCEGCIWWPSFWVLLLNLILAGCKLLICQLAFLLWFSMSVVQLVWKHVYHR